MTGRMNLKALSAISFAAALVASVEASASTAANTSIVATARVNYTDAGGTAQPEETAFATVIVTLVPSAPTLSSPPNTTISQGTNGTLTYTITGTANGPDTYNLTSAATATNMSSVTPTFPGGTSISLGGTTLAESADDTETSIVVPYDNNSDSDATKVNGIAVGDKILIGNNVYEVASITENAGANTTTIGLTTAISGGTVAAAQIVGEQQTFTVSVPSGSVTSGGSGSQSVSTTATSGTAPNPATTQTTPTVITINRPTLTVQKFVSADDGANFLPTVNAAPSTNLIYKIIVSNGGATAAEAVTITDVVPQYLTYVSGFSKSATDAATAYTAATALTEGSGGYDYIGATRTVTYVAGTLAGNSTLVLFFRATID